jgi:hypothetical protein
MGLYFVLGVYSNSCGIRIIIFFIFLMSTPIKIRFVYKKSTIVLGVLLLILQISLGCVTG